MKTNHKFSRDPSLEADSTQPARNYVIMHNEQEIKKTPNALCETSLEQRLYQGLFCKLLGLDVCWLLVL